MSGVIGGNGVITAGRLRLRAIEAETAHISTNIVADHAHLNNATVNDTVTAAKVNVTDTLTAANQNVTNVIHNHEYQNLHIGNFELTDASGTFVISKDTTDASGTAVSKRLVELTE